VGYRRGRGCRKCRRQHERRWHARRRHPAVVKDPITLERIASEPGRPHLAQTAKAGPGHDGKPRRRSHRGRGEESDGCIVPVKPRTMPAHVGGGDGGGKAAGRREGEQRRMPRTQGRAWHVPEAVSLRIGAAQVVYASELRSRWTFDRSPVRESRTVGSVRGCALQARRTQLPEMAAAAKPSEQPRTESCVASGNGRCEA